MSRWSAYAELLVPTDPALRLDVREALEVVELGTRRILAERVRSWGAWLTGPQAASLDALCRSLEAP